VYWIWICIGPRTWIFFEESLNGAFLLAVAILLCLKGRAAGIQSYFLGQAVPNWRNVPKAVGVLFALASWVVLTNLLEWHWVGAVPPLDRNLRFERWLVTWPVTEEIVCRGIFLAVLLRYTQYGRWAALLISALVFASLHCQNRAYYVMELVGDGLILGYAYMETKSVPFCMVCHSMSNGIILGLAKVYG
jgi:membrane protease YdiL (CAAX protease family)